MRKTLAVTLSLVMSVFLLGSLPAAVSADEQTILHFNTMVGIPASFTGTLNPIRGIDGGGLPWMLTSAEGKLSSGGKLELEVQGLVLAAGPKAGTNPVPNFRAIVSCLTTGGVISNVSTDLFPATIGSVSSGGGDAQVETMLSLPTPCIAPILFVTSPGGAWFAATGR